VAPARQCGKASRSRTGATRRAIRNPEAGRLARALAARRGTGLTEAIKAALRDGLARMPPAAPRWPFDPGAIRDFLRRDAALPVLDTRSDDELMRDVRGAEVWDIDRPPGP
jgi:antitoxin VapB